MKNNENVVTVKKIVDNLKSKWWILVMSLIVALVIIFYSNYNGSHEEIYTVKTFLCTQAAIDEIKENSSNKIILEKNEIDNNNLMNQNSPYIAKMMSALTGSEGVKNEVLDYMKEKGQEEFFDDVEFKFFVESRIIECTLELEDAEKAVTLINAYSDVLCEKINDILEGERIVVLEYATVPEDASEEASLFSIKNVFIALICICGGLFCILLFALADKKVREPYEVENILPITYWGRVRQGKYYNEDVEKIRTIINKKKINNGRMVFTALSGKSKRGEDLSAAFHKMGKDTLICFLNGDEEQLKKYIEVNRVVLLICSGKDEISDVEEAFVWLTAMEIEVEGYLLID